MKKRLVWATLLALVCAFTPVRAWGEDYEEYDWAVTSPLYTPTDFGIFASQDGSIDWVPYGESLPRQAVFDIAFQNGAPRVLLIATHRGGPWERSSLPAPVELQVFEIK